MNLCAASLWKVSLRVDDAGLCTVQEAVGALVGPEQQQLAIGGECVTASWCFLGSTFIFSSVY